VRTRKNSGAVSDEVQEAVGRSSNVARIAGHISVEGIHPHIRNLDNEGWFSDNRVENFLEECSNSLTVGCA
jgi:hypothetical protein